MNMLLFVGAGGAVGSMARYLAQQGAIRAFGADHPYGTFFVNVLGGLLMGLLTGTLALRGGDQERWRLLLGVGVLGGFTTFSSFSLDVVRLMERRAMGEAAVYVLASTLLSILAVMAGLALVRRLA